MFRSWRLRGARVSPSAVRRARAAGGLAVASSTSGTAMNRAAEFRRQGFTVVRGLFSAAEAAAILDELRRATAHPDDDLLTRGTMEFWNNRFVSNQRMQALLCDPRLIEVLVPIAGPNLWVRWDQAVSKPPGAGTFPWHQDNAYSRLVDRHLQVWVALTPMNEHNGGLRLQPGSHRRRHLPHHSRDADLIYRGEPRTPIAITADAGDIVLFSSFTLHSTTPNRASTTRWAYVAEYMALRDFDPYVRPPYYVVARDGVAAPEFLDVHPAERRFVNRVKYSTSIRTARRLYRAARHRLPRSLRGSFRALSREAEGLHEQAVTRPAGPRLG